VWIASASIAGSGTIDVRGGSYFEHNGYWGGSGGGGHVALEVDALGTFDPMTQVLAAGGKHTQSSGTVTVEWAGPGLVRVLTAAQTHGEVIVQPGDALGLTLPTTPLPAIGTGTVGTAEADAVDPADLWIEPADGATLFGVGVTGAWLRLDGTDYRVLDQTSDRRRLLLEGAAATVTVGDGYEGVYKLDKATVRGGAVLEFLDRAEIGVIDADGQSSVVLIPNN